MTTIDSAVITEAIDPSGCVCDDCLRGTSVPLHRANVEQLNAVLEGRLANATGLDFSDIEAVLDTL